MAKFIYKMQGILQIKYKLEEQAKADYMLALNILRQEEEKLDILEQKKEKYEQELRELMFSSLNILEIKGLENGIENAKYAIQMQKMATKDAEKVVEVKRKKLEDEMKERKTHEKLREKAFEDFIIELNAQEKKEIDELVSYRYNNVEDIEEA